MCLFLKSVIDLLILNEAFLQTLMLLPYEPSHGNDTQSDLPDGGEVHRAVLGSCQAQEGMMRA